MEDSLGNQAFCPAPAFSQAEPTKLKAAAVHKIHQCRMWPRAVVLKCLVLCLYASPSLAKHHLVVKLLAGAHRWVSLSSLQWLSFGPLREAACATLCIEVVAQLWEMI